MSSNPPFKLLPSLHEYESIYPFIELLNPGLSEKDFINFARAMYADDNYALHGAFIDEKLVGVAGCWITTKFYTGKYLEIDNFIIAPEWRGKKIGERFVQYILRIAKDSNCRIVMLDAYLNNKAAHTFYNSLGFEAKGYHFIHKI